MKLSIILVNYKMGELTQACIDSLYKGGLPERTEIIVVDNASGDNSAAFLQADFPEVKMIENEENMGLAFAVNQGIDRATGEYYLQLNPDIVVAPGTVEKMVEFMDSNQDVGVSGGMLQSPNGELQYSAFRFYTPMTVLYRRTWLGRTARGQKAEDSFLMKDADHSKIQDVDWLMGSCMLLRKKAVDEVGGMDERFFLYFEDVDWCRRFWEKGWRVTYMPKAVFSHFHQQSSRRNAFLGILNNWATREHIRSAVKYFVKYWGKKIRGMKVKLDVFEGPYDLLLEMVRAKKVDVSQVALAQVTDDFIEYVSKNGISPELKADFLVVAALLLKMKLRALLPTLDSDDDEEQIPMAERLVLYKKYRDQANKIALSFGGSVLDGAVAVDFDAAKTIRVSKARMRRLARNLLLEKKEDIRAGVYAPEVKRHARTLSDCLSDIQGYLKKFGDGTLEDIVKGKDREVITVMFLAVLELARKEQVKLDQEKHFAPLRFEAA